MTSNDSSTAPRTSPAPDPELARPFGGPRHGEDLGLEIGRHAGKIPAGALAIFNPGEWYVRRTGGDVEQGTLLKMPGQARHDIHNGHSTAEEAVRTSNIPEITGQVRRGDRR